MPNIKVTSFNKLIPVLPGLRQLELSKFSSSLGEDGLTRLLGSCKRSLEYLALPYTTKAVSLSVMNQVSLMPRLLTFIMGHASDDLEIYASNSRIPQLKRLFKQMLFKKKELLDQEKSKSYRLKNVVIYECNSELLSVLVELAGDSLEKFSIAKYYQRPNEICESQLSPDSLPSIE